MSFKEKPESDVVPDAVDATVAPVLDSEPAPYLGGPHRGLKMRNVQLIAISGSIGSALFVSIGGPLTNAGPLGLLLGLSAWCSVVWCAANSLIEPTTLLPIDGGFIQLSSRFVDRSFGMAVGWNYYITQLALVNFELTAVNVVVGYWTTTLSPAVMISVTLALTTAMNIWKVSYFGEAEFWISISKVILIIGLTLYTFVTMVGGNPLHDVYGFRFWKSPGPFGGETSAKQVVRSIFDSALWGVFAVVGPDYLSLVSGEVKNPRRIMPRAYNATIYRIMIFYVVGALCVGIVTSSNDPHLLGAIADGAPGAAQSPYIISMNRLGIPILPHIVNGAVLVSLISTTNSFIYTSSRSVVGLSARGLAPKFFSITNRHGVPYIAVATSSVVGCLSYMSLSNSAVKVLNWWINLVSSTSLVTWACIAVMSLRYRAGLKAQGLFGTGFVPVKGKWQPWSQYWLFFWSVVVFFCSGYSIFLPGGWAPEKFVFTYGSLFIFLAIWVGAKTYDYVVKKHHTFFTPASEMDFDSDIKEIEALTVASEERRLTRTRSRAQKFSNFLF